MHVQAVIGVETLPLPHIPVLAEEEQQPSVVIQLAVFLLLPLLLLLLPRGAHDFITGLATGFGVEWTFLPEERRLNILLFGSRMPPPLLRFYQSRLCLPSPSLQPLQVPSHSLPHHAVPEDSHPATLPPKQACQEY